MIFDDFSMKSDYFWWVFDEIWWFLMIFRWNLIIFDDLSMNSDDFWCVFDQIWWFLMSFRCHLIIFDDYSIKLKIFDVFSMKIDFFSIVFDEIWWFLMIFQWIFDNIDAFWRFFNDISLFLMSFRRKNLITFQSFDDFSMQCADFKLIFDEIWWFLIFSESNLMSDIFRLSLYPQSIDINVIPTECTENRCKSNRRYLDATIQRAKLPHKGSLPVSRCKLLMFDDFSIHFDDFWGSFDDIWWFFITFRLNLMILDNFPITFDTCWRFFNQIWLFLMIFRWYLMNFDDFSMKFDYFWLWYIDELWWFLMIFRSNLMIFDDFSIPFNDIWWLFDQIEYFWWLFSFTTNHQIQQHLSTQ